MIRDTYLHSAYEDLLRAANIEYASNMRGSTKLACIHLGIQAILRAIQISTVTETIQNFTGEGK